MIHLTDSNTDDYYPIPEHLAARALISSTSRGPVLTWYYC